MQADATIGGPTPQQDQSLNQVRQCSVQNNGVRTDRQHQLCPQIVVHAERSWPSAVRTATMLPPSQSIVFSAHLPRSAAPGGWGREKGRAGSEPGLPRPFSLTGIDAVPPPESF